MTALADYARSQNHEAARARGDACAVPRCFNRPPCGFDYCSRHQVSNYIGAALLFVGGLLCVFLAAIDIYVRFFQ